MTASGPTARIKNGFIITIFPGWKQHYIPETQTALRFNDRSNWRPLVFNICQIIELSWIIYECKRSVDMHSLRNNIPQGSNTHLYNKLRSSYILPLGFFIRLWSSIDDKTWVRCNKSTKSAYCGCTKYKSDNPVVFN